MRARQAGGWRSEVAPSRAAAAAGLICKSKPSDGFPGMPLPSAGRRRGVSGDLVSYRYCAGGV